MRSPALAERAPKPYIALHPEDAAELGLRGGETVPVRLSGEERQLQVLILPGLARGLAGIPAGLQELLWLDAAAQFWEYQPDSPAKTEA